MAKLVSRGRLAELLAGMARPVSMDRNCQTFGGMAKLESTVPLAELLEDMARLVSMDQLRRIGGTAKLVSTGPFAELLAGMARPVSMDRNCQTFVGKAKLDSKVWWW
jgi:hypothetical protein